MRTEIRDFIFAAHPRVCSTPQGVRSSWPAIVKRATLESPEIADLRLNCACPSFKWMTNELLGILLPAICIVFQTNQYRSCNGTFESRLFRQACAVRNEDSRYEIGARAQLWGRTSLRTRYQEWTRAHPRPRFPLFEIELLQCLLSPNLFPFPVPHTYKGAKGLV